MQKETVLYQFLYETLLTKIQNGFYKGGACLPPIHSLCETFHMSSVTVRKAIQLLKTNGYLRFTKNQYIVVERPDEQSASAAYQLAYLLPRKVGILELLDASQVLFPKQIAYAVQFCDEASQKRLTEILQRVEPQDQSPFKTSGLFVSFFMELIHSHQNDLSTELFMQSMVFLELLQMPDNPQPYYSENYMQTKLWCQQILSLIEQKDSAKTESTVQKALVSSTTGLKNYLNGIPDSDTGMQNLRFQWYTGKGKAQLSSGLTTALLSKIWDGVYPVQSFLPAISALSLQYNVSEITVRSAIQTLNSLGIISTINGHGSKVIRCVCNRPFNKNNKVLKKSLLIFLHALHFLLLTLENIILSGMKEIHTADILELKEQFSTNACPIMLFLNWTISRLSNQTLYNICQKPYSLLSHGIYLKAFTPSTSAAHTSDTLQNICRLLLEHVEAGNFNHFASGMRDTLFSIFIHSQKRILELGIEEARALPLPRTSAAPCQIF